MPSEKMSMANSSKSHGKPGRPGRPGRLLRCGCEKKLGTLFEESGAHHFYRILPIFAEGSIEKFGMRSSELFLQEMRVPPNKSCFHVSSVKQIPLSFHWILVAWLVKNRISRSWIIPIIWGSILQNHHPKKGFEHQFPWYKSLEINTKSQSTTRFPMINAGWLESGPWLSVEVSAFARLGDCCWSNATTNGSAVVCPASAQWNPRWSSKRRGKKTESIPMHM